MKFILSLLSAVGMGVNSMVLSPQSFVYQIGRVFPQSEFTIVSVSDDTLVIEVKTDNEKSTLEYTLENQKIVDVKYIMGT